MTKRMLLLSLALLVALTAPAARADESDPTAAATTGQPMVAEDANFDPYEENFAPMASPVATSLTAEQVRELNAQLQEQLKPKQERYQPKSRKVEVFDFDPSEGLTFFVAAGQRECFFQDAKSTADEISGAYVVSSADSHIDLEVKNPEGATMYRRFGDAEGQYEVHPSLVGVHELCFINSDSDGKLVTHVTNTLQSQHPVERGTKPISFVICSVYRAGAGANGLGVNANTEHVSVVAKYASHLDIRLGELESEQRLHQIRTERHIKGARTHELVLHFDVPAHMEESTSKRVSFYGTLECIVYLMICVLQVFYIKSLLDNPSKSRNWV